MHMHIARRASLLAATALLVGGASTALAAPGPQSHAAKPKAKTQAIHVVIKDVTTPDGSKGPAFIGPAGAGAKTLFTAHVGTPVVLTVVNQSTTMHTFTAKQLGLNSMLLVGKTSTITFTPTKAGTFAWLCVPPCGEWVMDNDGYMKGFVKVTKP